MSVVSRRSYQGHSIIIHSPCNCLIFFNAASYLLQHHSFLYLHACTSNALVIVGIAAFESMPKAVVGRFEDILIKGKWGNLGKKTLGIVIINQNKENIIHKALKARIC